MEAILWGERPLQESNADEWRVELKADVIRQQIYCDVFPPKSTRPCRMLLSTVMEHRNLVAADLAEIMSRHSDAFVTRSQIEGLLDRSHGSSKLEQLIEAARQAKISEGIQQRAGEW